MGGVPSRSGSVGLAGDGWGARPALRSLQARFSALEVLSGDPEVLALLRPEDRPVGALQDFSAGTVVCAGYQPIVPAAQLRARDFVNIHYALLPRYRGMHSTVWAILNGEPELGLTIHLMNEDIDDGPILGQYRIPYAAQTSAEVMEACHAIVARELGEVVRGYLEGRIQPAPQDKSLATWVPRRNHADCRIDFRQPCEQIARAFKALVRPYPLPMLVSRGVEYEVSQAEIIHRPYLCTEGRVVNVDGEGAWIKIADGLLLVRALEREGQPVAPQEVLTRGQRL